MVTIKDIAEKAGVSRGTVDRVLHDRGRVSPSKAKKIKEIAEKMGYRPNIAGKGLAARKMHLKIGFIYLDSDAAPFHRAIYEGALAYARQELEPYGIEVIFFPISVIVEDPTSLEQEGYLRELIGEENLHLDGWAVVGTIGAALESMLKKQGIQKTPIVVYNMDEDFDWKLAYVGCDYTQSGRLACGVSALLTNECGHVCILSFDSGNIPSSVDRIDGFQREIADRYPDIQILDTRFLSTDVEPDHFLTRAREMFAKYDDAEILYLVNPGDYSICREISRIGAKHKIKIITNDLVTTAQQKMVKNGEIAVTICQEPEKQGAKPLEILFQYLALGKMPDSPWYKTELSVRIAQNV